MGRTLTRRQILILLGVGGTTAVAGCPNDEVSSNPPAEATNPPTEQSANGETPSKTLVIPSSSESTVSPESRTGETDTGTPTNTETESATRTPTQAESTPTVHTPRGTPAPQLVISADETQSESVTGWYRAIEWYETGRLVIEDGAGIGLVETEHD